MSYGKEIENEVLANEGYMPNFSETEMERINRLAKENSKKSRIRKSTRKPKVKINKPTLVVVGESMVDPKDVAAIKKIRSKTDLYIVILKSQPNMEFPMWANGVEIAKLIEHFNVIE